MAKIILKGIVQGITPVETVGQNNTQKQSLILFVPGYVDGFGDKKGIDETWSPDVLGDKIAKLNLNAQMIGQRAECVVYVSSRAHTKLGKTAYFIGASLAEIKLLGKSNMPTQGVTAEVPVAGVAAGADDDDLPF